MSGNIELYWKKKLNIKNKDMLTVLYVWVNIVKEKNWNSFNVKENIYSTKDVLKNGLNFKINAQIVDPRNDISMTLFRKRFNVLSEF